MGNGKKHFNRLCPDEWNFAYVCKNLSPDYEDTEEMLDYLIDVARGITTERPDCFEWEEVVEKLEHILVRDKRFWIQEKVKVLLNLIRDICHDTLKHKIKKLMR